MTDCSFAYLSYDDFARLIQQFPSEYVLIFILKILKEKFKMYEDKIMLGREKINLGVKCLACNINKHDIDQCPYLHLTINR